MYYVNSSSVDDDTVVVENPLQDLFDFNGSFDMPSVPLVAWFILAIIMWIIYFWWCYSWGTAGLIRSWETGTQARGGSYQRRRTINPHVPREHNNAWRPWWRTRRILGTVPGARYVVDRLLPEREIHELPDMVPEKHWFRLPGLLGRIYCRFPIDTVIFKVDVRPVPMILKIGNILLGDDPDGNGGVETQPRYTMHVWFADAFAAVSRFAMTPTADLEMMEEGSPYSARIQRPSGTESGDEQKWPTRREKRQAYVADMQKNLWIFARLVISTSLANFLMSNPNNFKRLQRADESIIRGITEMVHRSVAHYGLAVSDFAQINAGITDVLAGDFASRTRAELHVSGAKRSVEQIFAADGLYQQARAQIRASTSHDMSEREIHEQAMQLVSQLLFMMSRSGEAMAVGTKP